LALKDLNREGWQGNRLNRSQLHPHLSEFNKLTCRF